MPKRKTTARRKPTPAGRRVRGGRTKKSTRKPAAGLVVRVRDWPGSDRERFLVTDIVDNPKSEHPKQVYALNVYRTPNGYQATGFRAFPFELCEVDDKMTEALADHVERVARAQEKRRAAAAAGGNAAAVARRGDIGEENEDADLQ